MATAIHSSESATGEQVFVKEERPIRIESFRCREILLTDINYIFTNVKIESNGQ